MFGKPFENPTEFLLQISQTFDKLINTIENVGLTISRLADRQRINIDSSRILYHDGVPSTLTKIYTVPKATAVEVRELVITSTVASGGATQYFTLYVVKNGASPATTDVQYNRVAVRPEETVEFDRKLALEAEWELHVQASAADTLNLHISGVELVTS